MMKNTEWGAIAYLQHSKYGSMTSVRMNNNSNYLTGYATLNEPTCGHTGDNRDCNRYGTTADVTQPWNTVVGYLASTTGNITGVYDMSGGSWEYVMGVMADKNGKPMSGRNSLYNSGFNGGFGCSTCDSDTSGLTELKTGIPFPTNSQYYDIYAYSDSKASHYRRILGDAIGEMGPFILATYGTQNRQIGSWYGDEAWFIASVSSFFLRGGRNDIGIGSGIFSSGHGFGLLHNGNAFRLVLI